MDTLIRTAIAACTIACLAPPAGAAERAPEFGVTASAGYQYDSNVNLAELDTSTGQADTALLLEAGANGKIPFGERLTLTLGYDYAETRYQDFSEFDLGIHQGRAEIGYRLGRTDIGVALRHFTVLLDRDRFLDIRQVSPSVSRLFGDSLYLRAAYTNADKRYASSDTRDAVNDALEANAYVLLDGMRHYLAFGLRADDENAVNDELDYDGRRLTATWGRRIEGFARGLDLKARLQFEQRDYRAVTEAIGAARRDERRRASLVAGLPLSDAFRLEGEAEYVDNASNLASAAYDEAVYSVSLAAEF